MCTFYLAATNHIFVGQQGALMSIHFSLPLSVFQQSASCHQSIDIMVFYLYVCEAVHLNVSFTRFRITIEMWVWLCL